MSKIKLVAFIGPAGSGKDTAYNIFKKIHNVPRYALADRLKDICSKYFNLPRNVFDNGKEVLFKQPVVLTKNTLLDIAREYGLGGYYSRDVSWKMNGVVCVNAREILQKVGTDFLRQLYPGIHYLSLADNILTEGVITDIRFKDEFEFFDKNFDLVPFYLHGRGGIEGNHVSEAVHNLASDCIHLFNDGTIFDLKNQMEVYCNDIFR